MVWFWYISGDGLGGELSAKKSDREVKAKASRSFWKFDKDKLQFDRYIGWTIFRFVWSFRGGTGLT